MEYGPSNTSLGEIQEAAVEYVIRRQEDPALTTISSKDQMTLPAKLLREVGLAAGDRRIARRFAALRACHGFALSDAIIVATAIESGCEPVVGNDKKWRRLEEIAYVHLDEIAH